MGPADGPVRMLLVALMVAVAAYHLARLVAPRRGRTPDVDLTHALMGAVMAVMLARGVVGAEARVGAACFVLTSGWFVVRAVRTYVLSGAQPAAPFAVQTVPGVAMAYMLTVAAASRPDGGMAMPAQPSPLAWLIVAGLVLGAVPQIAGSRPTLDAGCRVAMSATACLMLLAT